MYVYRKDRYVYTLDSLDPYICQTYFGALCAETLEQRDPETEAKPRQ